MKKSFTMESNQNKGRKCTSKISKKERISSDFYECPLCGETLPEADKLFHEFFSCRTLLHNVGPLIDSLPVEKTSRKYVQETFKERISSDFYECPLCGETLPEADKPLHESFSCRTLLHNVGPLIGWLSGPRPALPAKQTSRNFFPETYENPTETCINCKKKIPLYDVFNHKQSCNKTMTKQCAFCEKELNRDEPDEKHLRICQVYNQIDTLPAERTSKKYVTYETYEKSDCKNSWLPFPFFGVNKSSAKPTLDEHQNDRNEFYENHYMTRYPKRDEDLYFAQQQSMMDDEPNIPCEFCDKLFPASEVVLHTTGCNPTDVSLPKPLFAERQKANETSSRQIKRYYDSTITSESFFPAGRGTSIPSTKNESIYKRLEQSMPGQYLHSFKFSHESGKSPTDSDEEISSMMNFIESNTIESANLKEENDSHTLDKHDMNSETPADEVSETDLLSQHFKDLLTNANCWDTVLQVGSKEFKVHRTILIARSSVFSAMFQHETEEKKTGIAKIPDCDPDSFQQFLEYLYCGKLKHLSSDIALDLYTISDKYNIQELKTFCIKYLMKNITLQNICEIVILADMYDESELFSAAEDDFNKNFKEIVMTSEWESLMKKNFRLANKLLIGKAKAD